VKLDDPEALELLRRGSSVPRAPLRDLRAGSITAVLDGIDLRYIRVGRVEIARRIYVGVRDLEWGTLPPAVERLDIAEDGDGFRVSFLARHADASGIDFLWHGEVQATIANELTYTMDGRAQVPFEYNRIGLCVLHADDVTAGQRFEAKTETGVTRGRFPELVAAQQFIGGTFPGIFPPFTELRIELPGGGDAHFRFEGDVFEMEDQRNWTDASFKTYSTPGALGFPLRLNRDETRRQSVTIAVRGLERTTRRPRRKAPRLRLGGPTGNALPRLGTSLRNALNEGDAALLDQASFDHIRADVYLGDESWRETVVQAATEAVRLHCGLELALFLDDGSTNRLEALSEHLAGVRLDRVLVFASEATSPLPEETTPPQLLRGAGAAFSGVPIGGGTDMHFCELNRTRPAIDLLDLVSFPITPQVHAEDELTMIENLSGQASAVRSAEAFAGGRPICVGPITLRPRYNQELPRHERSEPEPDPRQQSLFCASWTLASVGVCARARASSLTYFEATGERGLLQDGVSFPVYQVLAALGQLDGGDLVAVEPSSPLEIGGLAVATPSGRIWTGIANLTDRTARVQVGPLPAAMVDATVVDESTFMTSHKLTRVATRAGTLELDVGPYGVAFVW
jgi:D-apionolactonase